MSKWQVPEARRTMGCVPSRTSLLATRTVSQNVAFALEVGRRAHATDQAGQCPRGWRWSASKARPGGSHFRPGR